MHSRQGWTIARTTRRGLRDPRRPSGRPSGRPWSSALGAVSILALALLGFSATLRAGLIDVGSSSGLHPATHYLDETLLAVLRDTSYDELASRKGPLGSGAETNLYRVSFAVNEERDGLLAIEAVLFDRSSGRELDRITTHRTHRTTDPATPGR